MKYFVCSDIHGYYTYFKNALETKGFDMENPSHHLIICGDLFDRGKQAKKLLNVLLKLKRKNRLTIILGNHEQLFNECLEQIRVRAGINNGLYISNYHYSNGTLDTIAQLTNTTVKDIVLSTCSYMEIYDKLASYRELYENAVYYKELGKYIFVHGWIPHVREIESLKNCSEKEWEQATWLNGMEEWYNGWRLADKTIVCGHWHTSFGNFHYHNKGSGEFEGDSDFSPFIDDGILALDACTAFSKKMNVYVLDIEENKNE